MNSIKLITPSELHNRAAQTKVETPIETIPLWNTVVGIVNASNGNHRASAPICGVYTTEYTIVPLPSSMIGSESDRVIKELRKAEYYVELVADSLRRFNEESLMVICWDPEVISAAKSGKSGTVVDRGMCILPGQENRKCDGCFDCHVHFQGTSMDRVAENVVQVCPLGHTWDKCQTCERHSDCYPYGVPPVLSEDI